MATATQIQTARVTRIRMSPPSSNSHEHITDLGGSDWLISRADVIAHIKAERWAFYTEVGGKRAYLRINRTASGMEYVQTWADGTWQNNLLALPRV